MGKCGEVDDAPLVICMHGKGVGERVTDKDDNKEDETQQSNREERDEGGGTDDTAIQPHCLPWCDCLWLQWWQQQHFSRV